MGNGNIREVMDKVNCLLQVVTVSPMLSRIGCSAKEYEKGLRQGSKQCGRWEGSQGALEAEKDGGGLGY